MRGTPLRSPVRLAPAAIAIAVTLAIVGAAHSLANAEVQTRAETISPPLDQARGDRGRPSRCPTRKQPGTKFRCIYGDRSAERTVVVLGDSKVMQHFPALHDVALRRGVRLVGLMRAGCPPMVVTFAAACDRWRRRNLRRLRRVDPELVVTSSGVAYRVVRGGKRLNHSRSRPILYRAYVSLLRELVGAGADVAVIVNPPRAPRDPIACVRHNREQLDRCAFERGPRPYHNYVARAARSVKGARRVDVNQAACPGAICPAVINDILVLRDRVHFTATYVRTLVDWLDARLPALD